MGLISLSKANINEADGIVYFIDEPDNIFFNPYSTSKKVPSEFRVKNNEDKGKYYEGYFKGMYENNIGGFKDCIDEIYELYKEDENLYLCYNGFKESSHVKVIKEYFESRLNKEKIDKIIGDMNYEADKESGFLS